MRTAIKLSKEDLHQYYQYGWETYWLDKVDAALKPSDRGYLRILQNIVALIPFDKDAEFRALDLGCGIGIYSINLLKRYPKMILTGVDLSQKQITIAKDLAARHSVNDRVEFISGDAEEWVSNTKYDLIVCTEMLEHLLEPQKTLKNIVGMSHKDTVVIFSVPQIYGETGSEGVFCKQILDDGSVTETQTNVDEAKPIFRYWHKAYKPGEIADLMTREGFCSEVILGSTFKLPLMESSNFPFPYKIFSKAHNVAKKVINYTALNYLSNQLDVKINRMTGYKYAETLMLRCKIERPL